MANSDLSPSHKDRRGNVYSFGRLPADKLYVMQTDISLKATSDFCPRVRKLFKPIDPNISASVFDTQYRVETNSMLDPVPPVDYTSFDQRVSNLEYKLNSLHESVVAATSQDITTEQ